MTSRFQPAAPLVQDAPQVNIFNSGLEVWLYDADRRNQLKSTGAFEEDASIDLFNTTMSQLVRVGHILAYQLRQDDSLALSVLVRPPLTKKEMEPARWLPVQRAYIRCPSGKMMIETNDSLTLRSSPSHDKGVEIAIAPGDYLATLHRIDFDALEADNISWTGPSEVITLSAGPMAKPLKDQPNILPWLPPRPKDATGAIVNGQYQGAVLCSDADTAMSIALTKDQAQEWGLVDKSLTRLQVPGLDIDMLLVWMSGDRRSGDFYARQERVGPPPGFSGGSWGHVHINTDPEVYNMFCWIRRSKNPVIKKKQNVWWPATMTLLPGHASERPATGQ